MLDTTTLSLFNHFPRNITLGRIPVSSFEEFDDYIRVNNTINDCYTEVFSHDVIDKVVFDYDYGKSFLVSKIAYQTWKDCGIPVIPDGTGRKGVHHFIPFEEMNPNYSESRKKELLMKAGFGLLKMVFRRLPKEVDTTVIGDTQQIIRIPNTARPPKNHYYCTYLPEDYNNMTESAFKQHMTKIHHYDYHLPCLLKWEEFDYINLVSVYPNVDRISSTTKKLIEYQGVEEGNIVAPPLVQDLLKGILRSCLFKRIIRYNPRHLIRVIAGIDLLQKFTLNQVVIIFQQIGWFDWNEKVTRYQLGKIAKYKPYSNRKLQEMQIMR